MIYRLKKHFFFWINKYLFILIFLYPFLINSESFRLDWIKKLEKEEYKVDHYNFFNKYLYDAPGDEDYYNLYYQNKKLKLIKHKEVIFDSADLVYDEEYIAYYSLSGDLEFGYYRHLKNKNVDDEYCFGTIYKNQKENFCEHKTKEKGKVIKKAKGRKINIPDNVNNLQTLLLKLENKSKRKNVFSLTKNINAKFRLPKKDDETIINGNGVRLRQNPSLESKIIKSLYPFQKVKVQDIISEKNEKWGKVIIPDLFNKKNGEPLEGYVSLEFLSPIEKMEQKPYEETNLTNSYWIKNKCTRGNPYRIMKNSNILSNPDTGIYIESSEITKNLEIQIEHKGCGEYWLAFKFILKAQSLNSKQELVSFKKYLELLTLAENKIIKDEENIHIPLYLKEAMIVLNKRIEENKIDFDEKIKYTDNELGQYFRIQKAQKSLKGITLQVDFIINL